MKLTDHKNDKDQMQALLLHRQLELTDAAYDRFVDQFDLKTGEFLSKQLLIVNELLKDEVIDERPGAPLSAFAIWRNDDVVI